MSARVGISLIGTPDGFESASIGASQSVKVGRKVDLDNSVINILPDTDLLAVRRDVEGGRLLTFVTYYRFAIEIKNFRTGSFYGCSMLFENFVPTRIPLVFETLRDLADALGRSCIDPSENRFRSHITPALLRELAVDGRLLEPATYVDGEPPRPGRVHDRRCFLLMDSDVPDYERFLSEVLLADPRAPSDLPSYRFVYTSRHKGVLDEVRLRRGLKVETLALLRRSYTGEAPVPGGARSRPPRPEEKGEDLDAEPAPAERPVSDTPGDTPKPEPGPSEQPADAAAHERMAPAVPTVRHDEAREADATSRMEMPAIYTPRAPSREQGMSDGCLVALAKLVERTFRPRPGGRNLLERHGQAIIAVVALLLAVLLVAYIFKSVRNSGGSTAEIYYYGCIKEAHANGVSSAATPQKCMADEVAEEFLTRLGYCDQYKVYLRTLNDEKGQSAIINYNQEIRNSIGRSIAESPPNKRSGRQDNSPLSTTTPTYFEVLLDFNGSEVCVNNIVGEFDPDFKKEGLPSPTPTPTPKPTATPTPAPVGDHDDRRSPTPAPTVIPKTPTPTPTPPRPVTPTPTPTQTQTPTPTPVTPGANNSNAGQPTPTPADKKPTENPATDSNVAQPAARPRKAALKKIVRKKGNGPGAHN
jgi:hypothetical protein